MKMTWRRVLNNPCAILERNDFGRKLWTVEVVGRGRVTDGTFDCFPLETAKQVATDALEEAQQ